MKIIELFGGIGAFTKALDRLGIEYEIADYVEINKYAVASYNAIHGTNFEPQDICKWDKNIKADFIMHGSPCQDFSVAGKNKGGDKDSGTRSSLMYETIRIVSKIKPKYVLWENVKNLLSQKHIHNFRNYIIEMDRLGYNSYYKVLNAKDYGIPQNRERVFTLSIRKDIDKGYTFPDKKQLNLKLKDMLENEVDSKYYLSDKMIEYIKASNDKWFGNNGGVLSTNKSQVPLIQGNGQKRCDASNYISNQLPDNYNLTMANRVADKILEKNLIKENEMVAISYSDSRLKEIEKGYVQVKNRGGRQYLQLLQE